MKNERERRIGETRVADEGNLPQESLTDKFVKESLLLLGSKSVRYQGRMLGITPEDGFDCSGFITYVLNKINYELPEQIRHADEYFNYFGELVHDKLRKKGDLVFFSRQGIYPTHVGILLSRDFYIHAPGIDDTTVTINKLQYKIIPQQTDIQHKQIYSHNPIGYKRLIDYENRLPTRKEERNLYES